jgi:hypothetical protein
LTSTAVTVSVVVFPVGVLVAMTLAPGLGDLGADLADAGGRVCFIGAGDEEHADVPGDVPGFVVGVAAVDAKGAQRVVIQVALVRQAHRVQHLRAQEWHELALEALVGVHHAAERTRCEAAHVDRCRNRPLTLFMILAIAKGNQ